MEDRICYETVSLCPTCETLVPGAVVERPHGVFVTRKCAAHGAFDGLVCSDVAWWNSLKRFDVEPVRPKMASRLSSKGCPADCGLCVSHRQSAGTAAIEISNRCNAHCPICLADNQETFDLSPQEVAATIDGFLAKQGSVDAVAISGGEPTIHPRLFEIIGCLERPEIRRIALNSNGRRIATDDAFVQELARHDKVYVCLHFDGAGARRLRGVDAAVQEQALDRLIAHGVSAVPLVLAAAGVNDLEIGKLVRSLLTRSPNIKSVMLSMMTYTGSRGSRFPGDPAHRLTIPAALERIEQGSRGALRKRDFIPLPMPNPMCAAIGYFLVDGQEITPLIPLGDLDRVIGCLKNANFVEADDSIEVLMRDAIDRIYACPGDFDQPDALLQKLRALLLRLFPADRPVSPAGRRAIVEAHVKTVYLFQFMDAWTFDAKRLAKCSCQHLLPGGAIIPSCGYYSYHRRFDARFAARGGSGQERV